MIRTSGSRFSESMPPGLDPGDHAQTRKQDHDPIQSDRDLRRTTMASEHTAKAFDSDLQELTRLVAEMGGLVERMITDSVDALIRRDVVLGKRVVASDLEIDILQRTIEERAVLTIARRQPMAID